MTTTTRVVSSDIALKDMNISAINPYALVKAILSKKLDFNSAKSTQVMSDVLQTDYDKLFDMKYNSVFYAGLKLNSKENAAEPFRNEGEAGLDAEWEVEFSASPARRKHADKKDTVPQPY
ncbi:Acting on peptide bonds (peptidase), partial [Scytalidium lignicola]